MKSKPKLNSVKPMSSQQEHDEQMLEKKEAQEFLARRKAQLEQEALDKQASSINPAS